MRALASLWDLWRGAYAERNKSHSLAGLGCAEMCADAIAAADSSEESRQDICPPSEDLEDLEQSGKAFKSGEEKAGSIKLIGKADTLPAEGFYD